MQNTGNLFDRFGGNRAFARIVDEAPSTVDGWRARRRVPAKKQPQVLERLRRHDLSVTAEDVMFPFPEDREAAR